jgi:glycosyltransferase involved in cell wall biosynthesis
LLTAESYRMHIAILTAGGAGMFCGSCMHDNTWARALRKAGAEVTLIPAYTPIRVDEQDASLSRVFLGGVNLYLDYHLPLWRKIPRPLVRWLDSPALLNVVSRFSVSSDAKDLGALTIALLDGETGPQRREIEDLADFVGPQLRPDVLCLSNILMGGTLRLIRRQFAGPIYCILQGDDIFLNDLVEPYRTRAFELIRERAADVAGFLVHSAYYRDFMSEYLGLPVEKFHILPLGIDLNGHDGQPSATKNETFTVGYFARICPEKGLHQLIEGFRWLHARHPQTRLRFGGYLGSRDQKYFDGIIKDARDLGAAIEHIGSPESHDQKVRFLKSLDVLSVPTTYREPKGLPVLEAFANGVPVVQPRHGAFPELLAGGGGLLFEPGDIEGLGRALESLLQDSQKRMELAAAGRQNVRTNYSDAIMAERSLEIFAATRSQAR